MRIITELIGGIILLWIFAYGVKSTIKFFNRGNSNGISTGASDSSTDTGTVIKPD